MAKGKMGLGWLIAMVGIALAVGGAKLLQQLNELYMTEPERVWAIIAPSLALGIVTFASLLKKNSFGIKLGAAISVTIGTGYGLFHLWPGIPEAILGLFGWL